jgi:hypothetical protein
MKPLVPFLCLVALVLIIIGGFLVLHRAPASTSNEGLAPVTMCEYSVNAALLNAERGATYNCESVGQTTITVDLVASLPLHLEVLFVSYTGASSQLCNLTSSGTLGVHFPSSGNGTFQVRIGLLGPKLNTVSGSVSEVGQQTSEVPNMALDRPYWRDGVGAMLAAAAVLVLAIAVAKRVS